MKFTLKLEISVTKNQAIKNALKLTPNYVAMDRDGQWYAYQHRPVIDIDNPWWISKYPNDGTALNNNSNKQHRNWKETLAKVE